MHSDLEVDVAFSYVASIVRVQAEGEVLCSCHISVEFPMDRNIIVIVLKKDLDIVMRLQQNAIVDKAEGDVRSAHFVVVVHNDVVFVERAYGDWLVLGKDSVIFALVPTDFDDRTGRILQGLLPGPIRRRGHRTRTL